MSYTTNTCISDAQGVEATEDWRFARGRRGGEGVDLGEDGEDSAEGSQFSKEMDSSGSTGCRIT